MKGSHTRWSWVCACAIAACASRPTLEPAYPLSRTVEEPFRARIPRVHRRAAWAPPAVDQFVLGNGLRVYAVAMPSHGLLTMTYVNRRFSPWDTRLRLGLPAVMSSLIPNGTRSHPGEAHTRAVNAMGAAMHSYVYGSGFYVTFTALPSELRGGVRLLAEAVTEPELDPQEFSRVIGRRRAARRQRGQSVVGDELALASLFGYEHPFAMPAGGSGPQLAALTIDDVRRAYRERFIPAHSAIAVVGQFDRRELERELTATFGQWTVEGASEIPPDARPAEARRGARRWQLVDTEARTSNASITVAWPMVALLDESFGDALVLDQLLGASGSGLFDQSLRERSNATYGVDVSHMISLQGGYGIASVLVATPHARSSIESLLADLARLRNTRVSQGEINAARLRLRNELLSSFESVDGTADRVTGLFAYDLPPTSWTRHLALIDAVTPESLQRTAQALLAPDRLAFAFVGDRAAIEQPVRALAPNGLDLFTFVE